MKWHSSEVYYGENAKIDYAIHPQKNALINQYVLNPYLSTSTATNGAIKVHIRQGNAERYPA